MDRVIGTSWQTCFGLLLIIWIWLSIRYQQDGATCHTATGTLNLLRTTFLDRIISCYSAVNWPLRWCDLTPLDYFLRDHVKDQVYAVNLQSIDALKTNILRVIGKIKSQSPKTVIENFNKRIESTFINVVVVDIFWYYFSFMNFRLSTLYINKEIQKFHPKCVLFKIWKQSPWLKALFIFTRVSKNVNQYFQIAQLSNPLSIH